MFSKKAEQELAVESARQVQLEKQFDTVIKNTDQITSPAEKVVALRKISEDIAKEIESHGGSVSKAAIREGNKLDIMGMGAASAAGIALPLLLGPIGWVGLATAVGAATIGGAVSKKRKKAVENKAEIFTGSHILRMESKIDLITAMTNAVVENNVKAISQSSQYEYILSLPGISDKFASAAAKQIAFDEAAAKANKKGPAKDAAAPDEAPVERPPLEKKPKPNYDQIKKITKHF